MILYIWFDSCKILTTKILFGRVCQLWLLHEVISVVKMYWISRAIHSLFRQSILSIYSWYMCARCAIIQLVCASSLKSRDLMVNKLQYNSHFCHGLYIEFMLMFMRHIYKCCCMYCMYAHIDVFHIYTY